MKIKKIVVTVLTVVIMATTFTACNEADRVSQNLSQEADNFNIVRQITVINCIQGDTIFQMTGRLSITVDKEKNKLDVIVESAKDTYEKHMIGLSDNVTYVIEDLGTGANQVDKYQYTLNYNPKMWIPVKPKNID